jgi:hypothetical protein
MMCGRSARDDPATAAARRRHGVPGSPPPCGSQWLHARSTWRLPSVKPSVHTSQ